MKEISFFPGFNALRFFAAYAVLMGHVELARVKYDLFNFGSSAFAHRGPYAVNFFFVLSGFLITYLLLREQYLKGTISIKKFYLRRIFRIWPLYYIIVFLGLVMIPLAMEWLKGSYDGLRFFPAIVFYILMLPNLVPVLYGSTFLYPLWSIGVEEQFYLLWAPLFRYIRKHFLLIVFIIVVARLLFLIWNHFDPPPVNTAAYLAAEFFKTMKFECMAIGSAGAFLVFYRGAAISNTFLFSRWLQLVCWLLVAGYFFFNPIFKYPPYLITISQSLVFLVLIINVGVNPAPLLQPRGTFLNFLGEISYGIYMYHSIVTFAVMVLAADFLRTLSPLTGTVVIYSSVSLLTVLVAWLSYALIEKRIISLKNRL